jgi:queuine/archaeosine tRNA-ribosyltransferase
MQMKLRQFVFPMPGHGAVQHDLNIQQFKEYYDRNRQQYFIGGPYPDRMKSEEFNLNQAVYRALNSAKVPSDMA